MDADATVKPLENLATTDLRRSRLHWCARKTVCPASRLRKFVIIPVCPLTIANLELFQTGRRVQHHLLGVLGSDQNLQHRSKIFRVLAHGPSREERIQDVFWHRKMPGHINCVCGETSFDTSVGLRFQKTKSSGSHASMCSASLVHVRRSVLTYGRFQAEYSVVGSGNSDAACDVCADSKRGTAACKYRTFATLS